MKPLAKMVSLQSPMVTGISPFNRIPANLPTDIITDIFSRLPVKSLMRLKCLSSFWYTLLSDQRFIKKHLHRAIQNNPNLILQLDSKLFSVDHRQWNEATRLELPFASSLEKVELSGSCHGLLCISDHIRNEDIFLYNPSTRKYKKLPDPVFDVPTIETTCFTALGFGYLPADDDYKVVRMVYLYDKPYLDIDSYQCEARIYSLRTDKWKKIGDIPFHISSRSAVWLENGTLVWKASRGFGRTMSVLIVSFNMDKEEFAEVPQPELEDEANSHIELSVLKGCLAIFHQWRNEKVEVWSMKESWTRLFVIGRPSITDEYFKHVRPVWVVKKGEILVEKSERELVLYDPENETFNDVQIHGAPSGFLASTCVGSLVSPFACLLD